jgi:Colicin D
VFLENYRVKSKIYGVVPSRSIGAAVNRTISFSERQVQRKFKHAADFGITGNYSRANAAKFQQVLEAHVSDPATQVIQGTYHGQDVTHFFNPNTGLTVIRGTDGAFISGWRLSSDQVMYLSTRGSL